MKPILSYSDFYSIKKAIRFSANGFFSLAILTDYSVMITKYFELDQKSSGLVISILSTILSVLTNL
jgi:hypothetical protein